MLGQGLGVEHRLGRQVGQGLDQVEQVAPVAVGQLGQPRRARPASSGRAWPSAASARSSRVSSASSVSRSSTSTWQREISAGGQREGRVLGGGADQRHRAVLDLVQQPVLLGAVEAVDLVDEQDRPPPARPLLAAPPRSSSSGRPRPPSPPRAPSAARRPPGPAAGPASSCRSRAAPTGSATPAAPRSSIRASGASGRSSCSWPTSSPSAVGRSRSASGRSACGARAGRWRLGFVRRRTGRAWRQSSSRGPGGLPAPFGLAGGPAPVADPGRCSCPSPARAVVPKLGLTHARAGAAAGVARTLMTTESSLGDPAGRRSCTTTSHGPWCIGASQGRPTGPARRRPSLRCGRGDRRA